MAHPDLDALLDVVLPFAEQQLKKHGNFLPFGATLKVDGTVTCNAVFDENPESVDALIAILTEGIRREGARGKIRAAGLCYDGRTIVPGETQKTDAVCVRMDLSGAPASTVFLPYKKGWFGRIIYGEIFATAREKTFFDA